MPQPGAVVCHATPISAARKRKIACSDPRFAQQKARLAPGFSLL
jgi:hypothetical protein